MDGEGLEGGDEGAIVRVEPTIDGSIVKDGDEIDRATGEPTKADRVGRSTRTMSGCATSGTGTVVLLGGGRLGGNLDRKSVV